MFSLESVTKVLTHLQNPSDDLIDRAHYILTTGALAFFAALIASSQTFGTPLLCMTGAHFPPEWNSYVNSYCYVTNTFVTNSFAYGEMPDRKLADHERIDVGYYQWIPYMLVAQAALFLVPHIFWTHAQSLSDIDFKDIVDICLKAKMDTLDDAKVKLEKVVEIIFRTVHWRSLSGRRGLGSMGALMFFTAKLLNIANVILQLLFLNYFIGHGRSDWGIQLLRNSLNIIDPTPLLRNLTTSDVFFPCISFCNFQTNSLGNVKEATVQCLLMTNMLNEKLFALIYIWLYILLVATVANFIYMVMRVVPGIGMNQSTYYLKMHDADQYPTIFFINKLLGRDGLLLLYFVKKSAGFSAASDIAFMLSQRMSATLSGLNLCNASNFETGRGGCRNKAYDEIIVSNSSKSAGAQSSTTTLLE